MITESVQNILARFHAQTKGFSKISPYYEFDYTWPSISLLQHVTTSFRGNDRLTVKESEIIKGVAAYLGAIAEKCWENMGLFPKVEDTSQGICITGYLENRDEIKVYLEKDINSYIQNPLRYKKQNSYSGKKLRISKEFYSFYASMLFTLQSQTILDTYEDNLPENFSLLMRKGQIHLATSCAEHYARIFPKESIGQLPEVYLDGLIIPFISESESYLGEKASQTLIDFVKEYRVPISQIQQFAHNLTFSNDEQIALSGFIFYVAVNKSLPSLRTCSRFEKFKKILPKLREAISEVRKNLNIKDWLYAETTDEESAEQIYNEILLGFFPKLLLSEVEIKKSIHNPEFLKLIKSVAFQTNEQSISIINEMIKSNPQEYQYKIQKSYCLLQSSNIQQAESNANQLKIEIDTIIKKELETFALKEQEELLLQQSNQEASEINNERETKQPTMREKPKEPELSVPSFIQASLANLLGEVALEKNDLKSALRHFEMAKSYSCNDELIKNNISKNYVNSLVMDKRFNHLMTVLDIAIKSENHSLDFLLLKYQILIQKNNQSSASEILAQLVKLYPFEQRVASEVAKRQM